jgi:transposase, IS30 family
MSFQHLSLNERTRIEDRLNFGETFNAIGSLLRVNRCTVKREVLKRRTFKCFGQNHAQPATCVRDGSCMRQQEWKKTHASGSPCVGCHEFIPLMECQLLNHAPYVCNGCEQYHLNKCRHDKMVYHAEKAEASYREVLVNSRSGVNLSTEEMLEINRIVKPRLDKHLSLHHIAVAFAEELPVSERTLYRLANSCRELNVKRMDLPRACTMKPRKGEKQQRQVERACRKGRTFQDYQVFREENPDLPVTEMDTLEGTRGGRVTITLCLEACGLFLMFIKKSKTALSSIEVLNELEIRLGLPLFRKLFPVILTDNGTEFSSPTRLESSITRPGERRTRIFYCEAYSAWQKPHVENGNRDARKIFPKGMPIPDVTQEKVDFATSNLNSQIRKSLNDMCAIRVFRELFGSEALKKLGLREIPAEQVDLTQKHLFE